MAELQVKLFTRRPYPLEDLKKPTHGGRYSMLESDGYIEKGADEALRRLAKTMVENVGMEHGIALLIGSGPSISSGIPAMGQVDNQIDIVLGKSFTNRQERYSKLRANPLALSHIGSWFYNECRRAEAHLNRAYESMAWLWLSGFLSICVTTNWDAMIEVASERAIENSASLMKKLERRPIGSWTETFPNLPQAGEFDVVMRREEHEEALRESKVRLLFKIHGSPFFGYCPKCRGSERRKVILQPGTIALHIVCNKHRDVDLERRWYLPGEETHVDDAQQELLGYLEEEFRSSLGLLCVGQSGKDEDVRRLVESVPGKRVCIKLGRTDEPIEELCTDVISGDATVILPYLETFIKYEYEKLTSKNIRGCYGAIVADSYKLGATPPNDALLEKSTIGRFLVDVDFQNTTRIETNNLASRVEAMIHKTYQFAWKISREWHPSPGIWYREDSEIRYPEQISFMLQGMLEYVALYQHGQLTLSQEQELNSGLGFVLSEVRRSELLKNYYLGGREDLQTTAIVIAFLAKLSRIRPLWRDRVRTATIRSRKKLLEAIRRFASTSSLATFAGEMPLTVKAQRPVGALLACCSAIHEVVSASLLAKEQRELIFDFETRVDSLFTSAQNEDGGWPENLVAGGTMESNTTWTMWIARFLLGRYKEGHIDGHRIWRAREFLLKGDQKASVLNDVANHPSVAARYIAVLVSLGLHPFHPYVEEMVHYLEGRYSPRDCFGGYKETEGVAGNLMSFQTTAFSLRKSDWFVQAFP